MQFRHPVETHGVTLFPLSLNCVVGVCWVVNDTFNDDSIILWRLFYCKGNRSNAPYFMPRVIMWSRQFLRPSWLWWYGS